MGNFSSIYLVPEGEAVAPKHTHPSQANWITVHAVAAELSIAEVERLWLRFQQLGCNKDGEITESMLQSMPIQNDAFSRNIMKNFLSPKTKRVTFENFLRGLKWSETVDVKQKLQGIYRMLNTGKPVPKNIFMKILERVYTNPADKKELERIADIFYKQLDTDKKSQFNEDQFVNGVMTTVPGDLLEDCLQFEVLPSYMKEKLHQNLPEFSSAVPSPAPNANGQGVPSTSLIRQVSDKIYKRDWERTANKLGLTSEDLDEIRAVEPDRKQQAFQMLSLWKRRDGSRATNAVLERALRDSGMNEAALLFSI